MRRPRPWGYFRQVPATVHLATWGRQHGGIKSSPCRIPRPPLPRNHVLNAPRPPFPGVHPAGKSLLSMIHQGGAGRMRHIIIRRNAPHGGGRRNLTNSVPSSPPPPVTQPRSTNCPPPQPPHRAQQTFTPFPPTQLLPPHRPSHPSCPSPQLPPSPAAVPVQAPPPRLLIPPPAAEGANCCRPVRRTSTLSRTSLFRYA